MKKKKTTKSKKVSLRTVSLNIANCIQCPHHEVRSDPDPDDWFCDDDVKVVFTLAKDREITVACRPYQTKRDCTPVPEWCPLRNK